MIPYNDIRAIPAHVRNEWRDAFERVTESGQYIGGAEVESFESEFAALCGASHCVGVGNGLDAITISLRALGVGPGHRVAVPGHTFIATWLAVLAVGAEPVAIDVDSRGQMDLDPLFALAPTPDAVVPVHLHGATVDMARVMAWARPRGVLVIEDCAQAHGATVDGRPVGSWGDAGAFSFYPTKNLGAIGDAGAVVTSSENVAARARTIRSYGSDTHDKYRHTTMGVNSRLDPIQAAVLRVNLGYLNEWNSARREVALHYLDCMNDSGSKVRPLIATADESVWHHFVVQSENRDSLRDIASAEGIGTDVHYPRTAADEIASILGLSAPQLPRSSELAATVLSLPLNPWLPESAVERVGDFLRGR